MREFYEAWWAELEPTFKQPTAIYLGNPADNPARLTSHDWITTRITPWNQSQVRAAMNGRPEYRILECQSRCSRTLPRAFAPLAQRSRPTDQRRDSCRSAGSGGAAYRETPGKAIAATQAKLRIGDQTFSKPVDKGAKEVVFEMNLEPKTTTMAATFETAKGETYGAYFVYVERMP